MHEKLNSKKHCCPAIIIEVTCLRESVCRADLCVCVAGPLYALFGRRLFDRFSSDAHPSLRRLPIPPLLLVRRLPIPGFNALETRASVGLCLASASLSLAVTTLDAPRPSAASCRLIACPPLPHVASPPTLRLDHPRLRCQTRLTDGTCQP